jgi:hypothetical protein
MQSQIDSDRLSLRTNLITTDRPDSSQVEDGEIKYLFVELFSLLIFMFI